MRVGEPGLSPYLVACGLGEKTWGSRATADHRRWKRKPFDFRRIDRLP